MKTFPYAAPCCEYDIICEATALLGGSDLTDDGAGDVLTGGEEYTF
ncbi:MAG: hypothetical protein J5640_02905 [Bacteroidales bacterium]|nr:hypothetical protein [Bacteroidales bacterium]